MRVFVYLLLAMPNLAFAQQPPLQLEGKSCRELARHVPDADVAFQPGKDARGRAVAPADLNATGWSPPAQIDIPVTVELQDRLGVPRLFGLYDADANITLVEYSDGKFRIDGQPLTAEQSNALAEACDPQE